MDDDVKFIVGKTLEAKRKMGARALEEKCVAGGATAFVIAPDNRKITVTWPEQQIAYDVDEAGRVDVSLAWDMVPEKPDSPPPT
jgi:hypothetical protein